MLTFPDPNVETEYTDPNGSVWEFNGTGWVRQCASDGGGDGGGSSAVGFPKMGWIHNGLWRKTGGVSWATNPVVIGDDIYLVETASQNEIPTQALRVRVDTSDYSLTNYGLVSFQGSETIDRCRLSGLHAQYNGDRAKGNHRYLQKEADGSVTSHDIDAGWNNARAATGISNAVMSSSIINKESKIVGAFNDTHRYGFIVIYNADGSVDKASETTRCSVLSSTIASTVKTFVVETDYGYCLAHGGIQPSGIAYAVAAFDKDLNRISNRNSCTQSVEDNGSFLTSNWQVHIGVPTSDGNGLGIQYRDSGKGRSFVHALKILDDGAMPTQNWGNTNEVREYGFFDARDRDIGTPALEFLDNSCSADGRLHWIRPSRLNGMGAVADEVASGGAVPISYTCSASDVISHISLLGDYDEVGYSVGKNISRQVLMPGNIPRPQTYLTTPRENISDVPIIPYKDGVWLCFRNSALHIYSEVQDSNPNALVAKQMPGTLPIETLAEEAGMTVEQYLLTEEGAEEMKLITQLEQERLNNETTTEE